MYQVVFKRNKTAAFSFSNPTSIFEEKTYIEGYIERELITGSLTRKDFEIVDLNEGEIIVQLIDVDKQLPKESGMYTVMNINLNSSCTRYFYHQDQQWNRGIKHGEIKYWLKVNHNDNFRKNKQTKQP